MSIDTPATIAIIGAGPAGLEAALYARYLGYDVEIFERGEVAEGMRRRGDVPLDGTWRSLVSPLGLAALAAQSGKPHGDPGEGKPTAQQWREQYLVPLSQTDLLADHLRLGCSVVGIFAVEREVAEPDDEPIPDDAVVEMPFPFAYRLTIRGADGEERELDVDAVIDATGQESGAIPRSPEAQPGSEHWTHLYRLGAPDAEQNVGPGSTAYLDQIRQLFATLGGRASLDLYRSYSR